jgi:hypothetical protein
MALKNRNGEGLRGMQPDVRQQKKGRFEKGTGKRLTISGSTEKGPSITRKSRWSQERPTVSVNHGVMGATTDVW